MRLRKEIIDRIARALTHELFRYGYVETDPPEEDVRRLLAEMIREDLRVEDLLNQEVRDILARYEREMDRGNIEYSRMFDMVKRRLVRERNLIL